MDVYICTSNIKCGKHEPRNLEFHTQNIQEWCKSCSEVLYFKKIVTGHKFDANYCEKQKAIKDCKLCEKLIYQEIMSDNIEIRLCSECYQISSGWIESTLIKKHILILYLSWWDANCQCIICNQKLRFKSNCQKWCSNCIIIYTGCRYCLTTNIIFGITEIYNLIKNNIIQIHSKLKAEWILYYQITNLIEIAKGGYGIIYKATWNTRDTNQYKIIAVKRFLNSQNVSKDFLNEVTFYQHYYHKFEYIIKYYGITQDPITKEHMIIMEYTDGGDLHGYLQKNFASITWKDKLAILSDISRGLHFIHKENFIHRDLHSGNI
ncbi:kinase-like domain-containing protein [Glomus cerebriforme]|uniref:Kinase-like domain-containing protein n=1 Tax=Glomus cerebriforme TaxID=658196 RepID=A0A397T2S6_9GLOM|nr:kinase-like domain-containing protein [Glomus cerebriforme]